MINPLRLLGCFVKGTLLPAVLLLASMIFALPVAAVTITVTTSSDLGNDTDGLCSLREAISSGNTLVQVDTCGPGVPGGLIHVPSGDQLVVQLPAGTYLLDSGASEDLNETGDLDITRAFAIHGEGMDTTTISGDSVDRVLDFHSATNFFDPAVVRDLTMSSGRPPVGEDGGCVRALSSNIIFLRTRIIDCLTPEAPSSQFGGSGGGLHAEGGTLEIRRTLIQNNTAGKSAGGGITIEGAIAAVVDSTIAGNRALNPHGTTSGGGLWNHTGLVSIDRSAIVDNEVTGQGGGVMVSSFDPTVTNIRNTTIARNIATGSGGGIRSYRELSLTNVTITENIADSDASGNGQGGGVRLGGNGSLTIKGSIVAWNEDRSPEPSDTIFPDISGSVLSAGFNIVLDARGLDGIIDGFLGDRLGTDPLLDLPTGQPEHFPLLPSSVAIDQIPRQLCTSVSLGDNATWANGTSVLMDQRGVGRGLLCEIGAFEDRPPEIFADSFASGGVDEWTSAVP